jgi:hypothetical protein
MMKADANQIGVSQIPLMSTHKITLEEFQAIFKARDEAKSPNEAHAHVIRNTCAKNLHDLEKLYGPPQVPPKQKANKREIGGDHYEKMLIQPWTAMLSWLTPEQSAGFLLGNAIKYLARAGKKGDALEDIKKAQHYLEKLIEVMESGHG